MRNACTLALLMAVFMAITAPNVVATESVQMTDHGNFCDVVTASGHEAVGGCHFQTIGEVELEGHVFGIEAHETACIQNFELVLDRNGRGYVQHVIYSPGTTTCAPTELRTCTEAEAHAGGNGPWPARAEEVSSGVVSLAVTWCIVTPSLGRCEGTSPLSITHTGEDYIAGASTAQGSITCGSFSRAEVGGQFELHNEGLELVHFNHL